MLLLPTGLKAKAAATGQTEMVPFIIFFFFGVLESLVLVELTFFLLRVPLPTLFWTLSTHCLTWLPPNRSPSTAPSWRSGHPRGVGRAIRAGWEVWAVRREGGRAGAPCSPGPGSFESCWLFLEGPGGNQAGRTGLGQTGRAGARPLIGTKLVVSSSYLP